MNTRTGVVQREHDGASPDVHPASGVRSKFYFGMAVAMSAAVFIGFGPSFYLNSVLAEPLGMRPVQNLSTVIVAHGLVFTAWMIMLVTQTGLAAYGRVRLHRTLGVAGAVLAALVAMFGTAAQMASIQRDVRSGAYDSSPFLHSVAFTGLVTLIVFAGLAGAAIYLRRRPQAHKRLILLATISLLGAATGRIGRILQLAFPAVGPLPFFGLVLTDLFLIALMVHDWRTIARLHAATVCGCLAILTVQVLGNGPLPNSRSVIQLVQWLAG
jgi:hypothetical protein